MSSPLLLKRDKVDTKETTAGQKISTIRDGYRLQVLPSFAYSGQRSEPVKTGQ